MSLPRCRAVETAIKAQAKASEEARMRDAKKDKEELSKALALVGWYGRQGMVVRA